MRHILFISYDFPSNERESAHRATGWVKHLPSFGWDVSILTVENREEQYPNVYQVKPCKFPCIPETAEKTNIVKKLMSGCLLPDKEVLWIPNALRKIKEITGKQRVDLIYTIAPPYSMSWLGYQAHCQTGIPWITDIRENWVGTKKHGIFSQFYKNIEKKMEETIIKNARRTISTSEEWCQFFYEKYPFWGRDRFVCIPDGYDREELGIVDTAGRKPTPNPSQEGNTVDDKIRLVCPVDKDTTHQYLLRAVKELLRSNPSLGEQLRVEFVGDMDEEHQRLMAEFSLEGICSSDKEEIRHLMTAATVIIIANKERNIPQAIYRCMAAMKPILGLCNKGAVENLIKKENLGWVAPFSSVSEIKSALHRIVDCHRKGILKPNYSLELSIKYEKKAITQMLADIFDKVLIEKPDDSQSIRQKFGYRGNL